MNIEKRPGTFILSFVLVTLLFLTVWGSLAVAAEEGALIRDAIVRAGDTMKNIQVYNIRNSSGWAVATFTYEDEKRNTRGASALLKKSVKNWEFLQFSGKTPTTDLLKQNNVPSNNWGEIIDSGTVSKTKPVLDFLHSKYPKLSFESIEVSGDYALATWYGGDEAGMTLLKGSGSVWKVLLSTGGVIDGSTMRKHAVPENHLRSLMGIQ